MARGLRKHSESGYMHLTIRGNGKQIIFEEKADYVYFLHLLKRFSAETKISICAFCLMENHVHLLICDKENQMALFMQKLSVTYTYYFNQKYQHTGHIFQGRYHSRIIDDEDYLLTVFRYILNNPREAGFENAADYPWSSYNRYGHPNSFVDTSVFVELLGSWKEYTNFISAKYEDDPEPEKFKKDDEWARQIIRENLHIESGTVLQTFDLESRNRAIQLLKEKGLSVRQIERLTGINRNSVYRIIKK